MHPHFLLLYFAHVLWCLTIYDTLYLTQAQHYGDRLFLLYAKLFHQASGQALCVSNYDFASFPSSHPFDLWHLGEENQCHDTGRRLRFRPMLDGAEIARVPDKYHLGCRFFLFVGRMGPRKNVPRLLRAFSLFLKTRQGSENYQLVLAGPGGPAFEELQHTAHQLGFGPSAVARIYHGR